MTGPWQDDALCKGSDPDLWVPKPVKGNHDYGDLRDTCRTCPVRPQCADYALDNPDLLGLWAGMTTTERHNERRRRRRRVA